jgi:hypothetical protein
MTHTRDTELDDFAGRLDALFESPPAGLESSTLEVRVLARVTRRQRLRIGVLSLSALAGFAFAFYSLSQAALLGVATDRFLEGAGNMVSQALYVSLGSGPLAAAATCGALTVLALAIARVLEEV